MKQSTSLRADQLICVNRKARHNQTPDSRRVEPISTKGRTKVSISVAWPHTSSENSKGRQNLKRSKVKPDTLYMYKRRKLSSHMFLNHPISSNQTKLKTTPTVILMARYLHHQKLSQSPHKSHAAYASDPVCRRGV